MAPPHATARVGCAGSQCCAGCLASSQIPEAPVAGRFRVTGLTSGTSGLSQGYTSGLSQAIPQAPVACHRTYLRHQWLVTGLTSGTSGLSQGLPQAPVACHRAYLRHSWLVTDYTSGTSGLSQGLRHQ
ncbi:hypothetical protein ACOMHN_031253 [Nucella lapillus]